MSHDGRQRVGPGPHKLFRSLAMRCGNLWGLPDLADSSTIEFSPRLTRKLALCRPAEGRIRLAAHLERGTTHLLEEVLCHELAHIAVYRLHGENACPHGPEWRTLVSKAGYEPRTKAPLSGATGLSRAKRRPVWWEHRCPVCQAVRIGGRPVPEWKCRDCREAGLAGDMIITRIAERSKSPQTGGHRSLDHQQSDPDLGTRS